MPITIITNAKDAAALLEKLNSEIAAGFVTLYGDLGRIFQKNVQDRIESQNDGKWAHASKWKKGTDHKVLEGAGKYVKYSASKEGMNLYGETPGEWTLTQHHEGFLNEAEIEHDGRVTIDIVNPGPLGLSAGTTKFSWVPKGLSPDKTPARQIWPTEEEAVSIITPVYSRWLQATVNRAVEGSGATIQGSAL
jgi:hypothetical protein